VSAGLRNLTGNPGPLGARSRSIPLNPIDGPALSGLWSVFNRSVYLGGFTANGISSIPDDRGIGGAVAATRVRSVCGLNRVRGPSIPRQSRRSPSSSDTHVRIRSRPRTPWRIDPRRAHRS